MAEALPSRAETTGAEAPSGAEVLPVVIVGDQPCPSWPRFASIALASSIAVHAAVILAMWGSRSSAPADSLALRSGRASVALQMTLPSAARPAPKPMEIEVTAVDAETPEPLRATEDRPARERADVEPARAPDPPDDPASELTRPPSSTTPRAAQQLTAMPQVQPEQVRHRRRRPLTPPPPSTSSPLAVAVSDPGVERETPEPLSSNRPPVYPLEAVAARAAGTTRLRVTISDEGAVVALEVKQSSGWSVLDQAALSAVATWRFEPQPKSIRGGKQTVIVPVVFQLDRR